MDWPSIKSLVIIPISNRHCGQQIISPWGISTFIEKAYQRPKKQKAQSFNSGPLAGSPQIFGDSSKTEKIISLDERGVNILTLDASEFLSFQRAHESNEKFLKVLMFEIVGMDLEHDASFHQVIGQCPASEFIGQYFREYLIMINRIPAH